MQDYSGANGTIKIFDNLDQDYLTNFNDSTLKVLADHDHTNNKIHGVDGIQAGTVDTASIADGAITSAKLDAAASVGVVANDTYLQWRNNADSANLDVLKVNTSDNLEIEEDIAKIRVANNVTIKGTTTGAADHDLCKVNTSNQWEFLNTAYVQTLLPKTDSTYDVGSSSLACQLVYTDNLRVTDHDNSEDFFRTGTWTPAVAGDGTAGVGTYSTQVGAYVKVGSMVILSCHIVWSAHTGSGEILLTGFPFTSKNTSSLNQVAAVMMEGVPKATGTPLTVILEIQPNTTQAAAKCLLDNTTSTTMSLDAAGSIRATIVYISE